MSNFKATLKVMPLPDKKALYLRAREEYYNEGNSTLTDMEYDALEANLLATAPKWVALRKTGIKVKLGKKSEVKLAVPCPSLDKIVADKPAVLSKWVATASKKYGSSFRLSEKVDGSSVEGEYTKGKLTELATRGDGLTGKSIMFLADHLNIPKSFPQGEAIPRCVVRFEAAMPVAVYLKKWAGQYDSARALASALLNRHDAAPALKDLDFIALRVMFPEYALSDGLDWLKRSGFKVARGMRVDMGAFDLSRMSEALDSLRAASKYECDGMVIFSDKPGLKTTADRPDYARAFKVNDEASAVTTTVVDIVWKPSAFGVLVPKAVIAPIKFGGVTVKQAALHNAKWAVERGVGIGAVVKVLRSGDIIPKIVAVVKSAPVKLPLKSKVGQYDWDKTRTSLVLTASTTNPEVLTRKIARLFSSLGLDQLSIGLAEKIVASGVTSTEQVVQMTAQDFGKLPGVKSLAKTYAEQMERLRTGQFEMPILMAASGCFEKGMGKRRLSAIYEAAPKAFLRKNAKEGTLRPMLSEVSGCGPAFAEVFCRGIGPFWEWVDATGSTWKKPEKTVKVDGPLSGKGFTWTTYRSLDEEQTVKSLGGEIVPFGSKTTVLFYDPNGKASSKIQKAVERGVTTSTFATFIRKYTNGRST